MHRISSALGAILIGLCGCGGGESKADGNAAATAAPANDYAERIKQLPEAQRNAVFLRAVRDTGADCQAVKGSAFSGTQFDMPSWVARCSDGRDWLVMIDKGGRALVARREEAPSK